MLIMSKPVSLNGLVFSDNKGVEIIREDYALEFKNEEYAEIFIQSRYKYWKELYKTDLIMAPDMNDTITEIEIKRILRLVSRFLDLRYKDVVGKSQKREYVEARRYAVMICIERGKNRSAIYKYLQQDHSTISHHVRQFNNYCSSDAVYKSTYDECSEFVLSQLSPQENGDDKLTNNGN